MKFLHLSDLHIGKRVHEFSMLEDQKYILMKIVNIVDEERPDAVLIAGDVYDKSVPSAEAVEVFDDFLVRLSERGQPVFIISGNHDCPERLAFANRLIDASGIHIAPVYNGKIEPFTFEDEFGPVDIYMLPFVKPVQVRCVFPEEEISSYSDAIAAIVRDLGISPDRRSVLITHQFVTGAARSESEEISVGGSDNVDASVLTDFDYVALGHIHGPQNIGSERIRYCGTPLKYSFSEARHEKSVTLVEMQEKGQLSLRTVPLHAKRDMVELKGSYEELTLRDFYEGTSYPEDYIHITLTDEEDIPDAVSKLRVIYRNLMKIDYDNTRTRRGGALTEAEDIEKKSPLDLFAELYEKQNGSQMSPEQTDFMSSLIEKIWEDEA